MRTALLVTAALGASVGCYSPSIQDCELQCGAGNSCPAPLTCTLGMCRERTEMGACPVAIDAPADDDAPDARSGMWSAPVEVPGIGFGFRDPTLNGDQTQMYLSRSNQILVSNYNVASQAWNAPTVVQEIANVGPFTNPYLSFDGLSLYVTGAPGAPGANDIWRCTRSAPGAVFMGLNPINSLNSTSVDSGGATSANGQALVMSSNRQDPNNTDLFLTTFMVGPPADWRPPFPMAALNHPTAADGHPVLDGPGLRIVFASDRSGNYDLYMSSRATDTSSFDPPQPISDLNTSATEADPWLSPDGRTLYFSRGPDTSAKTMKSVRLN